MEWWYHDVKNEFFSLPLFPQKPGPTTIQCNNSTPPMSCMAPIMQNAAMFTTTSTCSNCGTTCGGGSSLCPRCGCTMTLS